MIAPTLLIAMAAAGAEILHRRARAGIAVHPIAVLSVSRFAIAGAVLVLIRAIGP